MDGSSLLHQMFRVRWQQWKALGDAEQQGIIEEATAVFAEMENHEEGGSALFSQLGHKGDLVVVVTGLREDRAIFLAGPRGTRRG